MFRDALLLPWIFLCSRRVVLHFHAAGAADAFNRGTGPLSRFVRWLYSKATAAVVMTEFNRRDPAAAGISPILIVPHHIADERNEGLLHLRGSSPIQLLYVGHLCEDKGTPQLLEAFAALRAEYPTLQLTLVGECLPPFSQDALARLLDHLQIRQWVRVPGVLTGSTKAEAFARADLFVFPTIAPYESFGLVLVEAMAWSLPIVASDWRGNREVLTGEAGAVCFPTKVDALAHDLQTAMRQALQQQAAWPAWGEANRRIFDERYCENVAQDWLANPILAVLSQQSQ
jgi:glycosyltransferase involved in cell wall biosynthesis